ncbi:energy transducer TonB [Chitinophaga sp. GCM10012297]|uniref:Energy transducer TonB n=1 Tax=Chitinophaga chungangae TaxID=2821488 RepID=A0ABS3YL26_9BACT|nr:energy transducer TonB [Chitinophaga chungangae]MBO9155351.1 energy transducer TonB [Chitinophaga chungangae]
MIVLLFLMMLSAKPDCPATYDTFAKQRVYTNVDQWPKFPGGAEALSKHIINNLKYPADDEYIRGSYHLQFIVQADGRLSNIIIPDTPPEKYTKLDKEVIRVISIMPRWKPGLCKGMKVPVRMPFRIACILPQE